MVHVCVCMYMCAICVHVCTHLCVHAHVWCMSLRVRACVRAHKRSEERGFKELAQETLWLESLVLQGRADAAASSGKDIWGRGSSSSGDLSIFSYSLQLIGRGPRTYGG